MMPASELAITLAKLQGWTDIEYSQLHEAHTGNHPSLLRRVIKYAIPQPDVNNADAFALMQHVQSIRAVSNGVTMDDIGRIKLIFYRDTLFIVEWSIWRGRAGYAAHEELNVALATACKDSLLACEEKP